jgi:hypothetical protein
MDIRRPEPRLRAPVFSKRKRLLFPSTGNREAAADPVQERGNRKGVMIIEI